MSHFNIMNGTSELGMINDYMIVLSCIIIMLKPVMEAKHILLNNHIKYRYISYM